jgi:ABC-2 type transport system permease protein
MRKIIAVVKREYLQIVRTKGFIIGTVLGPLLMSLFIVIPVVMSVISVGRQEKMAVIDASGEISGTLAQRLSLYKLKDGRSRYLLEEIPSRKDISKLKEDLNRRVLSKELTSYIFIPEDIIASGQAEFVSEHVSDFAKIDFIRSALNRVVVEKRLRKENLDARMIGKLMTSVRLTTKKVAKRPSTSCCPCNARTLKRSSRRWRVAR